MSDEAFRHYGGLFRPHTMIDRKTAKYSEAKSTAQDVLVSENLGENAV